MEPSGERPPMGGQLQAQQSADRIRLLRQELATPELQDILALTPAQQSRFDDWSRAQLAALAQQFDVDTSASQKRVSWGMRIASTLGSIAICAAVLLFFMRYWGYLGDRKSTRLNSSHLVISYAVFCLKKKKKN